MAIKTYTLLVTIDNARVIDEEALANHLGTVLEVGCEGWSGVASATASAFNGDLLPGMHGPSGTSAAKKLHAALRA